MAKYQTRIISIILFLFLVTLIACERQSDHSSKTNRYHDLFSKSGSNTGAPLPFNVLVKVNIDDISPALLKLYIAQKERKNISATKVSHDKDKNNLNELVNLVILSQKAQQAYFHKLKMVDEHLRFQRMALLARLYLDKMASEIKISDHELQKSYQVRYALKKNYEYKVSHIVVKTKTQAISLIAKLHKGAKFSKLARKNSIGPSSDFGGELEWFNKESISKPFIKAVKQLRAGYFSSAPVKTRHGWHIIMLEDKRIIKPPKYSSIRESLLKTLKSEKMEAKIKAFREHSDITTNTSSWPMP